MNEPRASLNSTTLSEWPKVKSSERSLTYAASARGNDLSRVRSTEPESTRENFLILMALSVNRGEHFRQPTLFVRSANQDSCFRGSHFRKHLTVRRGQMQNPGNLDSTEPR